MHWLWLLKYAMGQMQLQWLLSYMRVERWVDKKKSSTNQPLKRNSLLCKSEQINYQRTTQESTLVAEVIESTLNSVRGRKGVSERVRESGCHTYTAQFIWNTDYHRPACTGPDSCWIQSKCTNCFLYNRQPDHFCLAFYIKKNPSNDWQV